MRKMKEQTIRDLETNNTGTGAEKKISVRLELARAHGPDEMLPGRRPRMAQPSMLLLALDRSSLKILRAEVFTVADAAGKMFLQRLIKHLARLNLRIVQVVTDHDKLFSVPNLLMLLKEKGIRHTRLSHYQPNESAVIEAAARRLPEKLQGFQWSRIEAGSRGQRA